MAVEPGCARAALVVFLPPAGLSHQHHVSSPLGLAYPAADFVAIELRHAEIDQRNIGAEFFRQRERLLAIGRGLE